MHIQQEILKENNQSTITWFGGFANSVNSATIKNVYTIGKVEGRSTAALIYGASSDSKVTNAYWCLSNEGTEGSRVGTPIEKWENMNKQVTYQGFDFEEVWIMKEYPELR